MVYGSNEEQLACLRRHRQGHPSRGSSKSGSESAGVDKGALSDLQRRYGAGVHFARPIPARPLAPPRRRDKYLYTATKRSLGGVETEDRENGWRARKERRERELVRRMRESEGKDGDRE